MKQQSTIYGFLVLILVLITGVYSNHFHNDFHFDDAHTVTDNGFIRDIHNIPLFFQDCTTSSSMPSHQGYRPLVTTTLAIDYALTDVKKRTPLDPFWFHVSNFSWFLIIVVLLFFIQQKIYATAFPGNTNIPYFALIGSAWYGLHTANAETVNYIISRSDILSTLAIVASFAIYLQFEQLRKYYLYLMPVILGMFAKETTIMFAPALIAYDYLVTKQKSLGDIFTAKGFSEFFKSVGGGLVALVVCIALALFTIKMTKHHEPGGTSMWWYAASQPYIIIHYVTQFFVPMGLTADTDIPMVTSLSDDRLYFGIAFLVGLVVLIFKASEKREWRPAAFGLAWFILMLLPTSSFIALAEVTNDHRIFLPYIGLILAMVTWLMNVSEVKWSKRPALKNSLFVFLFLAFAGYAYGTHQRNNVWHKDETLWEDVTQKSPNNGRGWMNYGLTLMAKDSLAAAQYAYDQALTKTPRYYILHVNYGILQQRLGRPDQAEVYFKNALAFGANYVEPYYYYARFLESQYRLEEAEIYCGKALEIFPGHLYSLYLMMDVYKLRAKWSELQALAQKGLGMYPGDGTMQAYLKLAQNPGSSQAQLQAQTVTGLINQSLAYYNAGKYQECIATCRQALLIQPNSATAYNNICSAYCMLQKFDSAEIACNKSIELDPNYQQARNNLKWAQSGLKK